MTDRYVVPCGARFLVLDVETFAVALAAGDQLVLALAVAPATPFQPSPRRLLTPEQMERETGKPATWFQRQARERRIPAHKLGRTWHFDPAEIAICGAKPRIESVMAGGGDTGPHVQQRSATP